MPLARAGERLRRFPLEPPGFSRGEVQKDYRKDWPCVRRYLAVRARKHQGDLFADGSLVKHFAIVTNREGDGRTLLRWHREKAGPVEQAPHALKNE